MPFIVEKEFEHVGYKCVMIFGDRGYRCGYVGIPKEHPLYGKDYSDHLDIEKEKLEGVEIGKRGVMSLLSFIINDNDKVTLDVYFNVHGSLTYSGGGESSKYPIESDLWWFGFDCNHYGDKADLKLAYQVFPESRKSIEILLNFENMIPIPFDGFDDNVIRDCDYVVEECKRLAEQLKEFEIKND